MPIVLASPLTLGDAVGSAHTPYPMTWTGIDGSVWDLARVTGSVTMRRGVKGLHAPRLDVVKSSTPLVPGADLLGYSIPERQVYWPLTFFARSQDAWLTAYSGFFRSMHPIEEGLWTVGVGDGARTLALTYRDDGGYTFSDDPFVYGAAVIGIELEAARPLWRGKAIRKTFRAEDPVDFIPSTPGDEYNPSPIASFSSAAIDNPGDEPAYLTWTVEGPQADLSLGIGGAVIDVPFAVPDGSVLRIDTDPAGQFATLDGDDVTGPLGFQMFGPVPARGTSPLTIASSGTGSVTAELVPLYWRAFG